MKFFLKIKARPLFLLTFVVPFGLHFVIIGIAITNDDPEVAFVLIPFVCLIFMAIFVRWFWTLGTRLNQKVPEEIRINSRFFKFSIIYSAIYILCFLLFPVCVTTVIPSPALPVLIIPFGLFGMFCMFYALLFVSKNLAMAERKQEVGFYEFAGPFFLIWFYPIGVWFIQPRVNRIFQNELDT